MKHFARAMKVLGGAAVVTIATSVMAQETPAQSEAGPRLEEHLKDTNTASRLSPQEENEHTVRVKRLQELNAGAEPNTVIAESAGAESTSIQRPVASSAAATPNAASTERLIEAIEQLQMEIRELRTTIERQNPELKETEHAIEESQPQRFTVPPRN